MAPRGYHVCSWGGGESTSDGPFSSLLISYYYFVFFVAEMARNGNWVIAVVRGSL